MTRMRAPALLFLLTVILHVFACLPASDGPIRSFSSEKPKVTKGTTTNLIAVFEGGTASIDHDIGEVSSGVPIPTQPIGEPTTFTLTLASNVDGSLYTQTITVGAVDPAVITSFKQDKVVRPGEQSSITAQFAGGTGSVDNGVGKVDSGKSVSIGALAETKNYTLTVVNEAGDPVTAVAEAEAAVTPVIDSFTAPGLVVSRYTPTTLTAMYHGGHGVVDQDVGAIKNGEATPTKNLPFEGATFTLTVTNGLGEATTAQVSVTTKKELFLTDYGGDILVYDADSVNDVPPKRTFLTAEGKNAGSDIQGLLGVVVDGTEIFLGHEGGATPGISVWNVTDFDDAQPKRSIRGAATTIQGPALGVNMFAIGNGEIFVADKSNTIKIWNKDDNGNIAPRRTITGPNTGLNFSLAAYADNGELYVSNYANGGDGATITVYPLTANGNATPTRTLGAGGAVQNITGVTVEGQEIFASTLDGKIVVLNKQTGQVLRTISGDQTQLTRSYECSVADAQIFCASYENDRALIFPFDANGNVAPTRAVRGDKTYIASPSCVFVH